MKKNLLIFLSIMILSSTIGTAYSRTANNSELVSAIRLYKAGNYTECYSKLNDVIKKEPSNAYAYYYMAMTSAQIGKKTEAIANYNKALALTSSNSTLNKYATKGKRCLETPDKCHETSVSEIDSFIMKKGAGVTDEVRSDFEQRKMDNLKREINNSDDVPADKFYDYKDFSSMNNETPTNDEIVAAIRTLQNAGLGNLINNGNISDLSMLTGNYSQNSMYNMFGGNMSPQLLQTMLMSNMSAGF